MEIKLNDLQIVSYDSKNGPIKQFIKSIKNDELIKYYCGRYVADKIMSSENCSKLLLETGYMITNNNNLIGYIATDKLEYNSVGLECGVHPLFRNQGYGSKILKEVSDFLLQRDFIEQIDLSIDSENIYSEKCAINALFKLENENAGTKYYTKTLKRL